MSNLNYQVLAQYMEYLHEHFGVHICINDFVGFIPLDKELDLVLQPYMAHTTPYCMYIKSFKELMPKCQNMKKGILARCLREEKHFCGVCHAGVEEIIFPIFYNKQLLGTVNVGIFNSKRDMSGKILTRLSKKYTIELDKAFKLFALSVTDKPNEEKDLVISFNFLCSYLSNYFGKLSVDYHTSHLLKRKHNSSEDFVLSHCIQYIKDNYKNLIDVSILKAQCHCSESFINHIFKKRTGKSVKAYVNALRLEEAKQLLTDTFESISSIALQVGFEDPDYFSRVFTKTIGISPKRYRERFKR